MIKKILLFVLVVFPAISFAQENQKIAHIDYAAVITSMPEYKIMVDSLQKEENAIKVEFQEINDDYTKKMSDLIARQDSLSESIKIRKNQELQDIRVAAENFQQFATQKQQELEQALFMPIQNKLQKAINEVGAENNFLYIIMNHPQAQVLIYTSPNAVDATPLVKKKLGIQ